MAEMTDGNSVGNSYGRRKLSVSGRYVFDSVPGLSSFASISIGQGQRSVRNYVDNAGSPPAPMEAHSALDPAVIQAGIGYRDFQASILFHHLATTSVDGGGTAVANPAVPIPVSFNSIHGEALWTLRPNNQLEIVPRFNITYQTPWRIPKTTTILLSTSRCAAFAAGYWVAGQLPTGYS